MPQVRPSPRPARKASTPLPLPTTLLSPPRPPSASGALGAQAGGQVQGGGFSCINISEYSPHREAEASPCPRRSLKHQGDTPRERKGGPTGVGVRGPGSEHPLPLSACGLRLVPLQPKLSWGRTVGSAYGEGGSRVAERLSHLPGARPGGQASGGGTFWQTQCWQRLIGLPEGGPCPARTCSFTFPRPVDSDPIIPFHRRENPEAQREGTCPETCTQGQGRKW